MLPCKFYKGAVLCCAVFACRIPALAQSPVAVIQSFPEMLGGNAYCQQFTATFTSTSTEVSDAASYGWFFGSGAIPSIANGPGPHEVTFTAPGPQSVMLVVDNNNGSAAALDELLFEIASPVNAMCGGPVGSVCMGASFALSDVSAAVDSDLMGACSDSVQRFWMVPNALNFTLDSGWLGASNGSLGTSYLCGAWEPGSANLEVSVHEPGLFEAWLFVGSSCGYDSVLFSCEVIAPGIIGLEGDAWVSSEIELCSGDSIGAFELTSTSPSDSIFWELDVPNAVNGVDVVSGSGVAPISISNWILTNGSMSSKTVEMIVSQGCSSEPATFAIDVLPEISIFLTPTALPDTICSGQSIFVYVNTTVHDVYVEWEADAFSQVEGGSSSSSNFGPVIVDQLVNSTDSVQSLIYTITTPLAACPAEPFILELAVVPEYSLPDPFDTLVVCPGDSVFIPPYAVELNEVSYTWTVEGDTIGLESTGAGVVEAFVTENQTAEQQEATVFLQTDLLGCTAETFAHVVVLPRPVLTLATDSALICSGAPFEALVSSTVPDVQIDWESQFDGAPSGAGSGSEFSPLLVTDTLLNLSNALDTVHYTFAVTDHVCPSVPVMWSVSVAPHLDMLPIDDVTVCDGEQVVLPDGQLGIDSVQYSWVIAGGGDVGLASEGDSLLTQWMAMQSSNVTPAVAEIQLVASFAGCSDTTGFIVTVNPTPVLGFNGADSLVCSGDTLEVGLNESTLSGMVWWSASAVESMGGFANGSGDSLVHVLSNGGSFRDSVVYQFWIEGTACPADTVELIVEVWPEFSMDSIEPVAWCNGDSAVVEGYDSGAEGVEFTWNNSNASIGLPETGTGFIPSWLAVNESDTAAAATLLVTAQLASCPAEQVAIECSIHPTPILSTNVGPNGGLDCQTGAAFIEGFSSTGTGQFTFSGPSVLTAQGAVAEVTESGLYDLIFADGATGCTSSTEVFVAEPIPVEISNQWVDSLVCFGIDDAALGIDAGGGADLLYQWWPAVSTEAEAHNLGPGTYDVLVINASNCEAEVSFVLDPIDPILISLVDMGPALCGMSNGFIEVEASGGSGGFTYQWPQATGSYWWGASVGTHLLEVRDASNCLVDTVFSVPCADEIPVGVNQVLTPNGDGKNDHWVLEDVYLYPDHRVRVYNRWGSMVFEAAPYLNNWSGTWESGNGNGQPLPSATYYYLFESGLESVPPSRGFIEIQNEAR